MAVVLESAARIPEHTVLPNDVAGFSLSISAGFSRLASRHSELAQRLSGSRISVGHVARFLQRLPRTDPFRAPLCPTR
jgi:hypothetical protein